MTNFSQIIVLPFLHVVIALTYLFKDVTQKLNNLCTKMRIKLMAYIRHNIRRILEMLTNGTANI